MFPGTPVSSSDAMLDSWADEQALVVALREGSEEAFSYLITTYYGRLLRLAMTYVPTRELAEDIVQETWQGVLEGVSRFEGRSSLTTWIVRILSNRAKTRGKRERRFESLDSGDGSQGDGDDQWHDPDRFFPSGHLTGHWAVCPSNWDIATPEDLAVSKEIRAIILRAIEDLSPVQRRVITLCDVEEADAKEVCNIAGVTDTNQRVLLHRARAHARNAIEKNFRKPGLCHERLRAERTDHAFHGGQCFLSCADEADDRLFGRGPVADRHHAISPASGVLRRVLSLPASTQTHDGDAWPVAGGTHAESCLRAAHGSLSKLETRSPMSGGPW